MILGSDLIGQKVALPLQILAGSHG